MNKIDIDLEKILYIIEYTTFYNDDKYIELEKGYELNCEFYINGIDKQNGIYKQTTGVFFYILNKEKELCNIKKEWKHKIKECLIYNYLKNKK